LQQALDLDDRLAVRQRVRRLALERSDLPPAQRRQRRRVERESYTVVIIHSRPRRFDVIPVQQLFGVVRRLADSPVSATINTRFVERGNLTQRQSNRRLTRRTNGFSKDIAWFEKQLWLSMAYYHLVLPHHSLRRPLTTPEPARGNGRPR
jgi:hypothetical protein